MNTPFVPAKTIGALRGSNLCPFVESCVALLKKQGYKSGTAIRHVHLFSHLHRWLTRTRRHLRELNEELLETFWQQYLVGRPSKYSAPMMLHRLLTILREAGVTPPAKPIPRTPAQGLADDYRSFLREERGCSDWTVRNYARHIDRFLAERFGAGRVELRLLKIVEIIGFVQRTARKHHQGFTKQTVTALRSFLRFLHYRGKLRSDWAASVPCVAHWRLTALPKPLSAEDVQKTLDGCDRTTAVGRRDHAILLLLARLGLRAGEVVGMQMEDIDWENAQLTIRSKKGRGWARMPLPEDVGKAIARYLRDDRPSSSPCRNVFVCIHAPHTALAASVVVSTRASVAMKRAGVKSARKGAHILRHSLASEMLRQGASLDEIGQVLRHQDADTTAIYAKVDLNALRRLAVPLRGGVR